MSTYSAITSGEVDSDSPVTDTLMSRLWLNPMSVFECDASAPATLLPTVLLGTMTTTSGASQSLSSLVLTPYKYLMFFWNGVSRSAGGGSVGVGAATGIMQSTTAAADTVSGIVFVELATGLGVSVSAESGSGQGVKVGATGYSTATTSVSVVTSGTFDLGSVKVYGCK